MLDPASQPTPETFLGHAVRRETWTIAGRRFELVWPADIDALLDLPCTQERFDRDEYMPYWAQPWPVSVLLAEEVLAGPDGAGRPAIEIGCGIGLASIAAALKGWSVTATDYDTDAIRFAAHNASLNGAKLAGTCRLDYREILASPAYDLILGSDLLYERKKSTPVARWVASALRPGGAAWLSDPHRTAADGFEAEAKAMGFVSNVHRVETTAPAGLLNRGRIWKLTWPECARGVSPGANTHTAY